MDVVVLSVVFFHRSEYSSATEGIAEAVDESAAGSCIFEVVGFAQREQFGLACRTFGMTVHIVAEQFVPPLLTYFHVAVEQQEVFVFRQLGKGAVVAFGKAVVLVEQDGTDLRKFAREHLDGVVGRGIVGYDDVAHGIRYYGGQVATHHVASVPVEYDDCKSLHGVMGFVGAKV